MGVANQIDFRDHVIESTSPPMHEQMTNQMRHCNVNVENGP